MKGEKSYILGIREIPALFTLVLHSAIVSGVRVRCDTGANRVRAGSVGAAVCISFRGPNGSSDELHNPEGWVPAGQQVRDLLLLMRIAFLSSKAGHLADRGGGCTPSPFLGLHCSQESGNGNSQGL